MVGGGGRGIRRLRRYDMILEHITKKTRADPHVDSYTVSRSAPPTQTPQSTIAEPHVSVGINRSAPSSSHPALKSFPEVVLQKPAAEEDKRAAIPQAQRLLSSTQLSLSSLPPPPHLLLVLRYSLIPSSLPSLLIVVPLLFLHNLPFSLRESVPCFSSLRPSHRCNSVCCASLSYLFVTLSILCQYFAFCGTCN